MSSPIKQKTPKELIMGACSGSVPDSISESDSVSESVSGTETTKTEADEEILEWCEEHLPELYNPGFFDDEKTNHEVLGQISQVAYDTVLAFIEDDEERDIMMKKIISVATEWIRTHHTMEIESLEPVPQHVITELMSKPQTSQHSEDWYSQRNNRLTASEFGQILKDGGRRNTLLRKKIENPPCDFQSSVVAVSRDDGTMNPLSWGHRFEPIVRKIFEIETAGIGAVCDTMGRFTHPTIPWLSASPDGLVIRGDYSGRLIEIKAPYSREPSDSEFVYKDYYPQMQVQMEVCNLNVVEFMEVQFDQYHKGTEDKERVAAATWKGLIRVTGIQEDPSTWKYDYSDPVEDLEEAILPETGEPVLEISVWCLRNWYPRTILRNPIWWNTVGLPAATEFWAQVEKGRAAKAENPPAKEVETGWKGRN